MAGVREASAVGAALALAGGLLFILWSFLQTRKPEKPREKPRLPNPETRTRTSETRTHTARAAQQPQEAGTQVLVLGLEGAGKTSLLHCFATGSLEQDVSPTQGFNAISINREDLHIEFLEIGGVEKLREYWQMYLKKARVLVFVVDSANPASFPLAKTHLHQLLAADPYLPLVLLANKQDVPGARGVADLYEELALGSVGDARKLCVLGTQVRRGRAEANAGVQDARELIIEMMNHTHA
ncbi:ADP-ribosylation factor-like protein 9 isoform X3 [Astyanax mexicanus]|uniref:ADP-ribosylation factor-like protein 9 isoform X3 n=1 Tax=Astyanax mexicanus TaxID=7994 RepID=A0A8B9JCX8_ASTMX|nr:ADP-ribosylation factor-like protein 9 isoform X3 [Astyanax mexicanus]